MIDNPIIFYPSVFVILTFALISLFARNVIYSLLSAIVVFFFGALIFYVLGSEYNAIIQAAVYGLAVPVIIGVSIMFISLKNNSERKFTLPYLTVLCGAIFILAFIYLVMMSLAMMPNTFNIMEIQQVNGFDTILAFAKGIFVNYVWAFELVSLLLTIIIAGIVVITGRGRIWK